MGNQHIYQQEYIQPNKIIKPSSPKHQHINLDNIFGRVDIPSARA